MNSPVCVHMLIVYLPIAVQVSALTEEGSFLRLSLLRGAKMKDMYPRICGLIFCACLVSSVCSGAWGQSLPNTEKIQNIKRLIQIQGSLDDLKKKIDSQILAFREKTAELPPDYMVKVKNAFDEKDLETLSERFVSVYDKYLTDEEMVELVKFYESPVGQRVTKAMPQIASEQSAIAREWAQTCSVRVINEFGGLNGAVATGDIAKARDLLAGGSDVNAGDSQGVTPLMVAAFSGNADMAKLMVEKGADINTRAKRGLTPLMAAVQSGNKELVKFLLEKGADENMREEAGLNAYQLAAINRQPELMALLADKTTDKKPLRITFLAISTDKAKDCLPVMTLPSDSSNKIACVKLGHEVIPIGGVPRNNGWTLIQYPAVGWVPPGSIKQTVLSEVKRSRIAGQQREATDGGWWGPVASDLSGTPALQMREDVPTVDSREPFVWWRR